MTLRILKKISCACENGKDVVDTSQASPTSKKASLSSARADEKPHLHFYDGNNENNKSLDGTESHVQCQEQFGSEFDLKKYYVHGHDQKDDKLIKMRRECLKLEDKMLTLVFEFKQERSDLESLKYKNNGEKNLVKKMMKYEMINVAEKIENIESILQK